MSRVVAQVVHLNRTVIVSWDDADATIRTLKENLAALVPDFPPEQQRWVFAGSLLADAAPLSSMPNLQRETLIHVLKQKVELPPPPTQPAPPPPTPTPADPPRRGGFFTNFFRRNRAAGQGADAARSEPDSDASGEWRRPPYEPLPEVKHALPAVSAAWAKERFYLWCVACDHRAMAPGQQQELQLGVVRPLCKQCGSDAVLLAETEPLTWLELFQDSVMGQCLQCNGRRRAIKFEFHCRGERLTPLETSDSRQPLTVCKAKSATTLSVALPNVVDNSQTQIDSLDSFDADAVQVQFHPCGCRYSLAGFLDEVTRAAAGQGGAIGTRTLRSMLVRNSEHPEIFGQYALKCLSANANCNGIAYLPSCKVLSNDMRAKIKDWAVVEHMLSEGGVLCNSCQTPFFPDGPGPRQHCTKCNMDICEQHGCAWEACPHGVRPGPTEAFARYFRTCIEEVFTRGGTCHPPCCPPGQKNEACTHMSCEHGSWCYFCEQLVRDKWAHAPSSSNFKTNRDLCAMYLQRHPECEGSPAEALSKFHRLKTLRLLHELRTQPGWTDEFDRLYEPMSIDTNWLDTNVPTTPITLEEIQQYPSRNPPYRLP